MSKSVALTVSNLFQGDLFSGLDAKIAVRSTHLAINDRGLELSEYLKAAESIFTFADGLTTAINRESNWFKGDILNYGEETFPEEWSQAVPEFDVKTVQKSLGQIQRICRKFHPSRRREKLSFGHHEVVYKLDMTDQDAWLDKAESEGWSQKVFRQEVRAAFPGKKRVSKVTTTTEEGNTEEHEVVMDHATAQHFLDRALQFLTESEKEGHAKEWPEKLKDHYKPLLCGLRNVGRHMGVLG